MSTHPCSNRLRSHAEQTVSMPGGSLQQSLTEAAAELDRLSEALAAATTKLEAVEGLPGKWCQPCDHPHSGGLSATGCDWGRASCSEDLVTALASPGSSLRERVKKAVEEIRGRGSADYNSERAFAYGASADLVQAALEGE